MEKQKYVEFVGYHRTISDSMIHLLRDHDLFVEHPHLKNEYENICKQIISFELKVVDLYKQKFGLKY